MIESSAQVDRPIGRLDAVPSGITGIPMSYFTPDPLPDLISRCGAITIPTRDRQDPISGLLLLGTASKGPNGRVDFGQARRFLDIMGGRRFPRLEDFIALGAEISPRATGLRDEIVFVGGKISTSARHVYSPEETLPSLMASLESGLASETLADLDPLIRSAIVGAFCAFAHPFRDGNGRWSRLMALSTARQSFDIWPSLVAVAFTNVCKHKLSNDVWPEARSRGLRRYLDLVIAFEQGLEGAFDSMGLHELIKSIERALLAGALDERKRFRLMGGLFATGYLPIEAMRSAFGLSARAAEGRLRSAATTSELLQFSQGALRIEGLLSALDAQTREAADKVSKI